MYRVLCAIAALLLCGMAGDEGPPVPVADYVVFCEITGEIDQGITVVVERAVEEAARADALIFIIDTPGGRVDSAVEITRLIGAALCPTIAWVVPTNMGMGAISAGALISYACDSIVMAPGANIGASEPIIMGPEGMSSAGEKSMSFLRSKFRSLGEENGHNPLLGEAMVDAEIALYGREDEDGDYIIFQVQDGQVIEATAVEAGEVVEKDLVDTVFEEIERRLPMDTSGVEREVRRALPGEERTPAEIQSEEPQYEMRAADGLPEGAERIIAEGKLLTLTAGQALEYGLIPAVIDSERNVLDFFGLSGLQEHRVVATWDEKLFDFLTSPLIAGILLMLGLGGLYFELQTPGFGVFGIIGLVALAVFFGSHLVLGLADWLDLLLVAVGVGLLGVEIFILPGFGIAGISGIVCILVGIYLSLTRVPFPEYTWDYERLLEAAKTITVGAFLFMALMLVTWRFLPRSALFNRLVLSDVQGGGAADFAPTATSAALDLRNLGGKAATDLHPAGRARIEGKYYDVVTRGEYIENGADVRVIDTSGNRILVREVKKEQQV